MNSICEMIKTITDNPGRIEVDTDLFESGILDSLGIVKLITMIEESFGVEVLPEDIIPENFSSVSSIVKMLDRYN